VFDPAKVMVDTRGFLYIAVHGSYEGLVMEDPNGKFLGFFGANQTVLSPLEAIKRMLYPKQMYANEMPKFPETINSIATDKNGYIYTVSGGTISTGQLKKLNIKGKDLIGSTSYGETVPWAAPSASTYSAAGPAVSGPQLADVAVDSNGNMIVVDQNYKFISNYDSSGGLLYFWGGGSTIGSDQVGLLKSPVALDVNSRDELFVLDDQENVVQVFRMSEFAQKVNEANRETLAGNYETSEKLWQDVLRLNAQFNPAIMGLANAAFYTGKYAAAKQLYKQAGDAQGYSDSFWQIRMKWFEHYFSTIASVLVILLVLYLAFSKLTEKSAFRQRFRNRKRSDNRLLAGFRFAFYFLRHPIDAFSDIHYENKGGYLSAIVILLLVYASLLIQQMATSFSFHASSYVDIYSTFTQFFTVWIAWVLCNYLVSSIYQGEGKFRDIFIGSSYVFLPFVVVGIPMALLSNVMTLSEGSIYNYVSRGMIVWVAALIFWQIQNVHNYTVGKTFMNIFLSLCTMLALGVSIFVTFGLTGDLFSLFHQMFQELSLR
jgi:hypothetical protein